MRLALVLAGRYPDLRGSQVLVQQLADGIRGRGHAVHLVTYGAVASGRPGPRAGRIARDLGLVARLWRTVRREAIDLIHAHNYEAAIASLVVGRATGRPVVYHGHTALAEELPLYFRARLARALAHRLGRLLDAHVPRRADFCIAVTEELGEILRRRGVAARDLTCIAPAAAPRDASAHRPRAGSEALVCYAGNLDGYQNLGFLLRSFVRVRARVPAARLVLVTHAAAAARGRRAVLQALIPRRARRTGSASRRSERHGASATGRDHHGGCGRHRSRDHREGARRRERGGARDPARPRRGARARAGDGRDPSPPPDPHHREAGRGRGPRGHDRADRLPERRRDRAPLGRGEPRLRRGGRPLHARGGAARARGRDRRPGLGAAPQGGDARGRPPLPGADGDPGPAPRGEAGGAPSPRDHAAHAGP